MCSPGDSIAITPGVYTETVEIDRDLVLHRDGNNVSFPRFLKKRIFS